MQTLPHFTVPYFVIRSLSRSEAQDDFILIQTVILSKCKLYSIRFRNSLNKLYPLGLVLGEIYCRLNRMFTRSFLFINTAIN